MVTQKGIAVPPALAEALNADASALVAFEALRPSCQRRYASWIEEAKWPETQARRVGKTVEMALDWKRRHDERAKGKAKVA